MEESALCLFSKFSKSLSSFCSSEPTSSSSSAAGAFEVDTTWNQEEGVSQTVLSFQDTVLGDQEHDRGKTTRNGWGNEPRGDNLREPLPTPNNVISTNSSNTRTNNGTNNGVGGGDRHTDLSGTG
ncbi:hypothetical protein WICPIJ_000067 [Wickerhamomyces pijperi]|uniref:Uncharacterized protein n=1 Tax=Wickerhamomyces pijperi TaxID=599730 RepID=A0A9P8TR67_WICPI|nr:hypothetical protein WICPIJ_000067 [Wickerhamomyces pijperi]